MKDLKTSIYTLARFLRHNIRIIFGSRFVYFILSAILFYIIIILINLADRNAPSETGFYYILILPAIIVILYPAAFGVQIDKDIRTLEVLFGVPDYRYKVWLLRILLVNCIAFFVILFLSFISHFLIVDIRIFKMAGQLMFPAFFCSTLAFMLSTVFKNGTAAAVVLVLVLIIFLLLGDEFANRVWMLYLNPFETSDSLGEETWQKIIIRNRIYISVASLLFLIYGLFNLQKRESFLK